MQRVLSASVSVKDRVVGKIGPGMLVLLGFSKEDTSPKIDYFAEKLVHLRIFSDDLGKMNKSLLDVDGEILIVSQFTLYGSCQNGRRPDFGMAMEPKQARILYERFLEAVRAWKCPVEAGVFGEYMRVCMEGDGPVTLLME